MKLVQYLGLVAQFCLAGKHMRDISVLACQQAALCALGKNLGSAKLSVSRSQTTEAAVRLTCSGFLALALQVLFAI